MCGIAGILSTGPGQAPGREVLQAMIDRLYHRGPDGATVWAEGPVGLAHARLSIIDLEGGWQPLQNEDNTVSVVFNGEIFNYIELRQQLKQQGHRFRTASDTEVIVHLYEQHGDNFVQHLNGQFAIALWDARRQRLVLARDRVGIRPLFYAWVGTQLVFASEVKALFAMPGLARRLDPAGLAGVFSLWATLPPTTVFEGVSQLPPGHLMVVQPGAGQAGARISRYWDWSFPGDLDAPDLDEAALAEELRALLIDAVRLQLRADVPVGAYLSGGLDSSIITTLIRNHTDTPLRTFSLTFEDAEFDESAHQQELVNFLGTRHSSIRCRKADIGDAFARMVWHAESPVVRTAPTPMMMLARSVRQGGYRVVLTGEGADEVFGGYDLFKEAKIRRFLARQPGSKWRPRMLERLYPYLAASPAQGRAFTQSFFSQGLDQPQAPWFAHVTRMATTRRVLGFFSAEWRERLAAHDPCAALAGMLPGGFGQWAPMSRDQYVEANTLMSGYLLSSQGDRMAMAASIEARFPFLDHRVIEFAGRLPPRLKMRGLLEKLLLKKSMRAELPPAITRRTKQPYRAPDSACFFSDGQPLPWLRELLAPQSLRASGLFDEVAVGKLLAKCQAGRAIGFGDNMALVGVVSTMLLHEQFVAGDPLAEPPAWPMAALG